MGILNWLLGRKKKAPLKYNDIFSVGIQMDKDFFNNSLKNVEKILLDDSTKKLLHDEMEDDSKRICEMYGVPHQLVTDISYTTGTQIWEWGSMVSAWRS
jgi:hypothetical protein